MRLFHTVFLVIALVGGCSNSGSSLPTPFQPAGTPIQPTADNLTVDAAVAQKTQLAGQILDVTGAFMGWQGKCTGKPPRSRSDWMLQGEHSCLYVSGPVPSGLNLPGGKKEIGKTVTVRGQLQLTNQGQPYLVIAR
ncbi:MAG: hypothetical protein U1F76_24335 [Candidatus Competibacteraceae bacterium]